MMRVIKDGLPKLCKSQELPGQRADGGAEAEKSVESTEAVEEDLLGGGGFREQEIWSIPSCRYDTGPVQVQQESSS